MPTTDSCGSSERRVRNCAPSCAGSSSLLRLLAINRSPRTRSTHAPPAPITCANFVGSDQIKKSNVNQLEVAWFYPYAQTGFNPIVVDDVMYVLGRNSSLIALDANTGKELWIHEGLAGITSRGVNYWQSEDGKDRRLLFSINSFLQEIDARTGKTILTFGENGVVDLRHGLARVEQYAGRIQSNSPGKIYKNLIR